MAKDFRTATAAAAYVRQQQLNASKPYIATWTEIVDFNDGRPSEFSVDTTERQTKEAGTQWVDRMKTRRATELDQLGLQHARVKAVAIVAHKTQPESVRVITLWGGW